MDYKKIKEEMVVWIRDQFRDGDDSFAVVNMNDSVGGYIALDICVDALGAENVIAVITPGMFDNANAIRDAYINGKGVSAYTIPITVPIAAIHTEVEHAGIRMTGLSVTQLPKRVGMSAIYAAAQSISGKIIDTTSLSELFIGDFVVHGDFSGDFYLFANLTITELCDLARECNVPDNVIALEENRTFIIEDTLDSPCSYQILDRIIKNNGVVDKELSQSIMAQHNKARLKSMQNRVEFYTPLITSVYVNW